MFAPLLRVPGPSATDLPPDVSVSTIRADLGDDYVSAPDEYVSKLVEQVERARDHGIDLAVVVLDRDPVMDSQLRDLATAVASEDGGTVLVLSPGWVGTYSDSLDRVTLEAAQDVTYTGNPVVSTTNFVDSLLSPSPPWTSMTLLVIAVVALVCALLYVVKLRRWKFDHGSEGRNLPATGDERAVDDSSGPGTEHRRT